MEFWADLLSNKETGLEGYCDNIESQNIEIDENTRMVLDALEKNKYVFLTGAAGTGKSYTTRKVIQVYGKENVAVTASTGAAAIVVGGDTIHKIFKLGINNDIQSMLAFDNKMIEQIMNNRGVDEDDARRIYFYKTKNVLEAAKLLIIDEISMLSAKHIEMIFYRIKQFNLEKLQILAVGDFLQLPPVTKSNEKKEYAFEHPLWEQNFKTVELTEVKRTSDEEFIYVLRQIRKGKYTRRVDEFIKQHTVDKLPKECNQLFSLRRKVEIINEKMLNEIEATPYKFKGHFLVSANKNEEKKYLKEIPTPLELTLKVGCRVMFTANVNGLYVNGEMGTVTELSEDNIKVMKDNGNVVKVELFSFKRYKTTERNGKIVMEEDIAFVQYPLTIGYASTIHKSQGASIDKVGIDCKGIFEDSQFYVAMSRAKDPNNLYIKNFERYHIQVDDKVLEFYGM